MLVCATRNLVLATRLNFLPILNHLQSCLYHERHRRKVQNTELCQSSLKKWNSLNTTVVPQKDIFSSAFVLRKAPSSILPYLKLIRFDRPIGTWLLFLPCTFSITLASPPGQLPDPKVLGLFALGSFLMRGAGCIINDLWDKDIDSQVARTKDRPLASGQLSVLQALTLLGLNLSCALAILLTFNWYTIIVGASSMVLVVAYPLMKRITYWPQAFLGITFNWGAVLGWCAVAGSVDWSCALPLYTSCLAWTLVYDTIYAHQDKEDDMLIGVKSTALRFGEATKPWLAGFSCVMLSALTATGVMCEQNWPYFAGVGLVAAHLTHQIYTVDLDNQDDCARKFRSNRNLGLAFWLAIMLANLLKETETSSNSDNAISQNCENQNTSV